MSHNLQLGVKLDRGCVWLALDMLSRVGLTCRWLADVVLWIPITFLRNFVLSLRLIFDVFLQTSTAQSVLFMIWWSQILGLRLTWHWVFLCFYFLAYSWSKESCVIGQKMMSSFFSLLKSLELGKGGFEIASVCRPSNCR